MPDKLSLDGRLRRELALLRAMEAPLIFFEIASTCGVRNGVANLTLEGGHHVAVDGGMVNDSRVTAHLRFPVTAISSIRRALDQIEEQMKPVPAGLKN